MCLYMFSFRIVFYHIVLPAMYQRTNIRITNKQPTQPSTEHVHEGTPWYSCGWDHKVRRQVALHTHQHTSNAGTRTHMAQSDRYDRSCYCCRSKQAVGPVLTSSNCFSQASPPTFCTHRPLSSVRTRNCIHFTSTRIYIVQYMRSGICP